MLKLYTILLLLLGVDYNLYSQESCKIILDKKSGLSIYNKYDTDPTYIGGIPALTGFVSKHFNIENNVPYQGIFKITCIVDKHGWIKYPRIKDKSVNDYSNGEREMLRVFSLMPKWQPGTCKKKSVDCIVTIPIIF
jgi:hypothetical protein